MTDRPWKVGDTVLVDLATPAHAHRQGRIIRTAPTLSPDPHAHTRGRDRSFLVQFPSGATSWLGPTELRRPDSITQLGDLTR